MKTSVGISKKFATLGYATLAAVALALPAQANLLTNGGFETTTNGAGQLGFNTAAGGWNSTGYTFLFPSGTADTTGALGQFGNLKLWGPNDGSNNGLPAASPNGGNFIGSDGAFGSFTSPISQTVTGLTVGANYTLGFYWAGAQQQGFDGANTEQWKVTLGNQTQSTAVVNNTSHGFTGWQFTTMNFTATSASEVLSFLAVGTPSGVPPFSLLDGVTLDPAAGPTPNPVPAPGTIALIGLGLVLSAAWKLRGKAR